LRDVGPGRVLSANLSTITAAAWTQLLLHSLLQDAIVKVPEWMRVAASVELCLLDLAEKLAKTLASDYILLSQWVRDARLHLLLPNVLRRNVLVLTAEKRSMTEGWQPSKRHAALVSSATDFVSLIGCLRKQDIFRPIDFPFDSVCIELSDDRRALSMLRPATVIAAMLPSKAASKIGPTIPKELESFANMTYMYYFTQEAAPTSPSETASQSALPVVAAPKGLDDLIDRSSGTTGRAASA
jgi:hypothetical protein